MRSLRPKLPMLLVAGFTLLLAWKAIAGILALVGHPGATLDDAFIHFQYARAIAEGHPLRYQAGEPISTGATSVLWPLVLAPFHAVGFRDVALLWPAWALSFAALGLLAWDAGALAKPLAGTVGAVTSAALVLAFGGLAWCAASGMEVVPFAWIIARTARRASEWSEGQRDRRRLVELFVCANAAALLRPEGALFSLIAAVVLVAYGTNVGASRPSIVSRALGLGTLVAPVVAVLVLRALSGSALTNTAVAKLLFTNPYLRGPALTEAIRANFGVFFGTLLQGEIWAAEFVPSGGALVGFAGLGAVGALAIARQRMVRGALILSIALAMLVPCFYVTFLWNRLRYLWPFATGWLIGLGCLAFVIGELAAKFVPRGRMAGPIAGGIFVGLFAAKMPGVLDDVAQSASGIDRQQVAAGRWARAALPLDARIGMNDAGGIAYFSDRKTFDIVGLTTSGEARYWTAGPASRFEHYEKMGHARLPTHFIVYPDWLGSNALLGRTLADFTVVDATILGGQTKRAAMADWSLLGSGELPFSRSNASGAIGDSLDVADLESEAEHGYSLEGAREGEQTVRVSTRNGARIADGGRTARSIERFSARLTSGRPHHLVVRLESAVPTRVRVRLPNVAEVIADIEGGDDWTELSIAVPAEASGPRTPVQLLFEEPVIVFHYWFALDR